MWLIILEIILDFYFYIRIPKAIYTKVDLFDGFEQHANSYEVLLGSATPWQMQSQ